MRKSSSLFVSRRAAGSHQVSVDRSIASIFEQRVLPTDRDGISSMLRILPEPEGLLSVLPAVHEGYVGLGTKILGQQGLDGDRSGLAMILFVKL